jgi:hypothetical protein
MLFSGFLNVQEEFDRALLFAVNREVDELRLEVCVHAVAFQETPGNSDGLNGVIDAFRPHGNNFNAFSISHVVGNGSSHGGGITFCGDFERHYRDQARLLLPPLHNHITRIFISRALGAVNQAPLHSSQNDFNFIQFL